MAKKKLRKYFLHFVFYDARSIYNKQSPLLPQKKIQKNEKAFSGSYHQVSFVFSSQLIFFTSSAKRIKRWCGHLFYRFLSFASLIRRCHTLRCPKVKKKSLAEKKCAGNEESWMRMAGQKKREFRCQQQMRNNWNDAQRRFVYFPY